MNTEIERYINFIRQFCPDFTEDELKSFANELTIGKFKKNAFYLTAGAVSKEMGFVTEGLVRAFYVDDKGEEITIKFIAENQYIGQYEKFITQQPANYYFQCLEPVTLVRLPYSTIINSYKQNTKFERYGRLVAEEMMKLLQMRVRGFLLSDGEKRYLEFMNQYPHLSNRISISHLSSFLGIKRQSLTRIRKKLATKFVFDT